MASLQHIRPSHLHHCRDPPGKWGSDDKGLLSAACQEARRGLQQLHTHAHAQETPLVLARMVAGEGQKEASTDISEGGNRQLTERRDSDWLHGDGSNQSVRALSPAEPCREKCSSEYGRGRLINTSNHQAQPTLDPFFPLSSGCCSEAAIALVGAAQIKLFVMIFGL